MVIHAVSCMTQGELWNAHRERLRDLASPRRMDFEAFIHKLEGDSDELLRFLLQEGFLRHDNGERYRFGLASAVRLAWKMGMGNAARERFLTRRGMEISAGRIPPESVELWQEVTAYLRFQRSLRNPVSPSARGAILLISGAAFALAMSWILGIAGSICLLGVIAFHELGHYAAMRMFGYRDTSIFFVPFLGAATTGSKPDASLSQEMIVLLAGPVPGIALGAAVGLARSDLFGSEWGYQLTVMLIVINVLNLLPVMPLDGGKVVDRVLLAGRPWLGLFAGAAGIAGFGWLAVWGGDPILLVFCLLFAIALRSQFYAMRLLRRAKAAAVAANTERGRAEAVFSLLADDPPRPFGRKVGLARFVESLWLRPDGSRLGRAGWLAGYGTVLIVAVLGGALALASAGHPPT
jgi:Zn-dependent protease